MRSTHYSAASFVTWADGRDQPTIDRLRLGEIDEGHRLPRIAEGCSPGAVMHGRETDAVALRPTALPGGGARCQEIPDGRVTRPRGRAPPGQRRDQVIYYHYEAGR